MNKLTPILIAAVCSLTLIGTGCSPATNNTDAGNTTTDSGPTGGNDAGPMGGNDAGPGGNDAGPGSNDAGPNCDGGGCYSCTPTNYGQLVNACTTAQGIAKNPTLPYLPDGGLPPLP